MKKLIAISLLIISYSSASAAWSNCARFLGENDFWFAIAHYSKEKKLFYIACNTLGKPPMIVGYGRIAKGGWEEQKKDEYICSYGDPDNRRPVADACIFNLREKDPT